MKKSEGRRAEFKPGKYIASKKASTFHAPKCDWAKKIKKRNQIWFNSIEEATNNGYKKHSCLEFIQI